MRAVVIGLVVLVVAVIGLGFYLHWFNFTVNSDKMENDAQIAKEVFTGKQATGTVKAIEADENRFTLTSDKKDHPEMLVLLTKDSKFWRNKDAVARADLKVGDEVTVKFREKDGKNEASSVVIDGK